MQNLADMPDEALVPAVTARMMMGGISPQTEIRWRRSVPGFPPSKRIGGSRFYRIGDLRKFSDRIVRDED
jgi:hypothetical protein